MKAKVQTKEQATRVLRQRKGSSANWDILQKEFKQSEASLLENELRYRTLFHQSHDAIVIVNPETAEILEFNDAACRQLGYSRDEFVGKSIFEFEAAETPEETLRRIAKTWRHNGTEFITKHRTKQGEIRDIMIIAKPIKIAGKRYHISIHRDVTERKRAEEAIQQSRNLLGGVFASQSDAIFVLDTSNPPRIADCNPAALAMFGYSRPEMLGKETGFLHVSEAALQKFRSFVYPAIEKKGVVHLKEFHMRRKDGTIFPTEHTITILKDKQGNHSGWVSLVRDITERKQAEEALRQSEQKYKALAENSLTGILIHQDGKHVYVNNRYAEMHGYAAEEILGMDYLELIHPDERKQAKERIARLLRGEAFPAPVVRRKLKKDGRAFWTEIVGTTIDYRGKPALMGNLVDITERKQAEGALKASEERYRQLFEEAPVGLFRTMPNSEIIAFNKAAGQILGYPDRESLLTCKASDFYTNPEDRKRWQEIIEQKGEVKGFEVQLRRTDGTIVWVRGDARTIRDAAGQVRYYEGSAEDITEHKKVLEALQQSERNFRTLAENSADGILIGEGYSVNIYANKRAAQITGYSIEELLHKNARDLIHPDDLGELMELYQKKLRGQPVPRHYEVRFVRKGGGIVPVEISATRTIWENQMADIVFLRDITERKQAEAELRKYQEHLEELVKQRTTELETANEQLQQELTEHKLAEEKLSASLQEKEMLLREIHHRVKNNLQLISSLLNLQSRYTNNKQTSRALEDSLHRVRAMAIIHEELYKSKNLASIDFAKYISSLAANLCKAFVANPDDIALKIDAQGDILVGIDTAIPCGLIINELVSNSLKHAFPAGKKGQISIGLQQKEDRLTITVSDNGIGFPTDLDFGNSPSLGLQLVNSLVQQLEGTLELDRSTGTSLTITIYRGGVNEP